MASLANLGLCQTPSVNELPSLLSEIREKKATTNTPSLNTQNLKVSSGRKFSKCIAANESWGYTHVQPLIDILHVYAEDGLIKHAKAVHGVVLKSYFVDEEKLILFNHIANVYCKCSDFNSARQVFDKMSQRNVFSWTIMIVGSRENGFPLVGFEFFCEMLKHGILPDEYAYSAAIQSCVDLNCIQLGKMVHAQIIVTSFTAHTVVSTSLLNMYAKLAGVDDACRVFSIMPERSQVSWNAMISGLTANGLHLEAFSHFVRMKEDGVLPSKYTFISVSKAVGQLGDVEKAKEVHSCAAELGMDSNVLVGTSLIDMYSKCKRLHDARSVFDSNFNFCGGNTPWNALISGYSQHGHGKEALELFIIMCQNGIKSDVYTYCSVFNAIATCGWLNFGKEVHGLVLKSGSLTTVTSINNAIAGAYAKCGSLEDVKSVFKRTETRDIVSWTTLVTACTQCDEWEEALATFSEMRREGFYPNEFTYSSVLVSCASLSLYEYGWQIHGLLCKAGFDTEKCTQGALIDMYAKCGSINNAATVFERIPNPDVVSCTAMISGYAQHGFTKNALAVFKRMEALGMMPNSITFLCALFACSHGGLVEEGLYYFRLMEEKYNLVPQMEHYACVVDLFGRVGHLDNALEFIRKMPIEPDEMVWQTLLAACRVYGNVEIGEIAAQKILLINPEHSATYVLLSNTYMATGTYEHGLGLRNVMKERGVKKEPGCSWIFIDGRVHKFYAGDQQHPHRDDIYVMSHHLRQNSRSMDTFDELSHTL